MGCDSPVTKMNYSTKSFLKIFANCAIAIILNILVATLFSDVLHIPLFMDTIFTVAITFYYGLVPGVSVALLYNITIVFISYFRGLGFQPMVMLFGICGALISLVTWLFARRKEEFQISSAITGLYLLLIGLCTSFVTIFTSGIIDFIRLSFFQTPDMIAPIREFTESFVKQKFSLFASCILGQIPVSFTDRTITTFLGYGLYKFMVKFFGEHEWEKDE